MKRLLCIVLLCIGIGFPADAGDTWAYFTAGGIRSSSGIMGESSGITWPSAEFAMGRSRPDADRRFLHGWSVGFRKDDYSASNGTYFTFRYEFRAFKRLRGSVRPSVMLTYGAPGVMLDRSWEVRDARGDQVSYGRVSPTRSVMFPFFKVDKAGIIYPSILFSARKHLFKAVYVEPTAGLHFIRFNEAHANFELGTSTVRDRWTISPSLSVRLSIRMSQGKASQ